MPLLAIRHNIEVAHRLYETQGKCEAIHGHSMWVELELQGGLGKDGMLHNLEGDRFEFGEMKKAFREYLDGTYDHRVLLNGEDPFAQPLVVRMPGQVEGEFQHLPGLQTMEGDPTTENIAAAIAEWACMQFKTDARVRVDETAVNAAIVRAYYTGGKARLATGFGS